MILLKNKNKKANIKIGNNIEIKDGSDFPFDLTLYGKSTQATRSGKNLYNVNDTVATSDASISKSSTGFTATRTSTSSSDLFVASHTKTLKANTTYTFYENRTNSSTCYFYSDNLFGTALTRNIIKSTEDSIIYTFVTDSTGKVVIGFYSSNQTQGDTITLSNIMILEGEYSSENIPDYEPYGVSPSPDFPSPIESVTGEVSVKVTGKNLFSDRFSDYTQPTDYRICPIKLEQGQQYILKATLKGTTMSGVAVAVVPYGDRYSDFSTKLMMTINVTGDTKSILLTINDTWTSPKLVIYANNEETFNNIFKNYEIQLEKGSSATEYEPYKESSLTIDLQGNELCSLPNGTKDEVNITNGEALLIKRVGKVVLDGGENWSYQNDAFIYNSNDILQTSATNEILVLSNYYKGSNTNYRGSIPNFNIAKVVGANTQIGIKDNRYTTIDDFKTWLSTHNVEVLYELAEPETINLGTVEMPHTYNGVSNITNSADTEMIVKYYKKFEFDKILRSGYNIDEQEYEIAKKQMANGKRKKILSSYVDCVIKIDLGLLDNKTYQEYKEQLEDGEYEYWSYKYNQYKKANFILTKPSITTEYAYDDEIGIDDMEITLEKSSDVS